MCGLVYIPVMAAARHVKLHAVMAFLCSRLLDKHGLFRIVGSCVCGDGKASVQTERGGRQLQSQVFLAESVRSVPEKRDHSAPEDKFSPGCTNGAVFVLNLGKQTKLSKCKRYLVPGF